MSTTVSFDVYGADAREIREKAWPIAVAAIGESSTRRAWEAHRVHISMEPHYRNYADGQIFGWRGSVTITGVA